MVALLLGLLRTFCHVAALLNSSWPRPMRGLLSAPEADADGSDGGSRTLLDPEAGPPPKGAGGVKPMEVGRGGASPAEGMAVVPAGDLRVAVFRPLDKDMSGCCSTDLLFPSATAVAWHETQTQVPPCECVMAGIPFLHATKGR